MSPKSKIVMPQEMFPVLTGQVDNGIGTHKTTGEMTEKTTFTGWDFVTIWAIEDASPFSYPYFQWQSEYIPFVPFG